MSGAVAWFFGGIRLRDNGVRHRATYAGEVDTDGGVTRLLGTINPDSPNFRGAIEVVTEVAPNTAIATLDRVTSFEIMLAVLDQELRSYTWGALRPLARVGDDTKKAAVTAAGSATGVQDVTLGAIGGGWTPAAGEYVVVREVGGPDGFVAQILNVPVAGTLRLNATQVVTSAWEVYRAELHWPEAKYVTHDPGAPPQGDPAANVFRGEGNPLSFSFVTKGEPTYALAFVPPAV